MTQIKYAAQFGISHTALIKIEKGFTSTSIDFLQDFALITGYLVSDFHLLAEEIILDLYSKDVAVVSSSYTQATCNKLIKIYGNKFYEKVDLSSEDWRLSNVLLLDSLGRTIRPDLLHKILEMVVLYDSANRKAKTKKLIDILKVNKCMERSLEDEAPQSYASALDLLD